MRSSSRRQMVCAGVMGLCLAVAPAAAAGVDRRAAREFLPPLPEGQSWTLVWSDEFEGDAIDSSKWERLGDWKRRDGYWVKEDAYLDGQGHLILRTKKDGERYTSGAVRTRGKFEHRYGYWVCRCQFPTQPGHWPAFWLMADGVGQVGDGGRDGTEIDIMEKPWRTNRITQNLHWDGYGKDHQSAGTTFTVPGLSEGFHTFGLHWTPEEYVFYVNGQETWRTRAGGVSQVPQFAKLTEEIGKWGGDITTANLPDYFLVDYVRVYDVVDAAKPALDDRKALIWEADQVRPSPQQLAWQQLEFSGHDQAPLTAQARRVLLGPRHPSPSSISGAYHAPSGLALGHSNDLGRTDSATRTRRGPILAGAFLSEKFRPPNVPRGDVSQHRFSAENSDRQMLLRGDVMAASGLVPPKTRFRAR